jgi:hypothetical protein
MDLETRAAIVGPNGIGERSGPGTRWRPRPPGDHQTRPCSQLAQHFTNALSAKAQAGSQNR